MLTLFFVPGACSLSADIVWREAGLDVSLCRVDVQTKRAGEEDYLAINPKGYVPALRLDDGQVLTECAVLAQYLADLKPQSGLAPASGTMARYRFQEWLNFTATEIHKGFGPLFNPKAPPEIRDAALARLSTRFDYLAAELSRRKYLMGESFTAADAYLYTCLRWSERLGVDIARWPTLMDYFRRVGTRPKVQEALKAEGLV